jgi:hypothetical protein
MAIDSRQKRASVAGIVEPDGTIDQGDRQTITGIYRGILAAAAAEAVAGACIAFGTPVQAIIAFGDGVQAVIAFGDPVQAVITFGEGSCQ